MAFWAAPTTEPKRKYRWILNFGGTIGAIEQYLLKKVDKPSFDISETEHKYINHTFWYPGRVTWNEIEMTLVDPVTPDASMGLLALLRGSGYVYPRDQMEGAPIQTISIPNPSEEDFKNPARYFEDRRTEIAKAYKDAEGTISIEQFAKDIDSIDTMEDTFLMRQEKFGTAQNAFSSTNAGTGYTPIEPNAPKG